MTLKIFGINVKFSYLFLLIITLLLICDRTGMMWVSLLAVLLHETAHFIAIKFCGVECTELSLSAASVKILTRGFTPPAKKLIISLSGPLVNLALSACIACDNETLKYFGIANLILGIFNLIPAKGLDGGDALYYALCALKGWGRADKIFDVVSSISIVIIIISGVLLFLVAKQNPTLLIVGVYLLIMSFIKV